MAWSAEKQVGMFVVGGLVLLGVMTIMAEDFQFYKNTYELVAYFPTVEGLQKSDPVTLGGVEVGKVSDMRVVNRQIEVHMEIDKDTVIRADSVAAIKMISLFGGMNVALTIGSDNARVLADGDQVSTGEGNGIDALMAQVSSALDDVSKLVASVNENQDKVLNKIYAMLDDNEENLHNAIASFQDAARTVNDAGPKVNELLDSAIAIADQVKSGNGTLGKLVYSDELYNNVAELTASVKDAAAAAQRIINDNEGDVRAAVASLKEASARVNDTLYSVNRITNKIDSGEGTLGKIVNDPQLYNETRKAVNSINEAAEGMREQTPMTGFLSVLFSAF